MEMHETTPWNWLFIGLLAFSVLSAVVIVFIALILKHAGRSREFLHTERMRSVELGHPLESPEPSKAHAKYMHNSFWIAFWMVTAVPGAAFSGAAAAAERAGNQLGIAIVIWLIAGGTSIAAVVCATVLMVHSRSGPGDLRSIDAPSVAPPKPLS